MKEILAKIILSFVIHLFKLRILGFKNKDRITLGWYSEKCEQSIVHKKYTRIFAWYCKLHGLDSSEESSLKQFEKEFSHEQGKNHGKQEGR